MKLCVKKKKSTYTSTYPPIHLHICAYIPTNIHTACVCTYIHTYIGPSIHPIPSSLLTILVSMHSFIQLSVWQPMSPCIHLPIISLYSYPNTHTAHVYDYPPSACISIHPPMHLYIYPSFTHASIHISTTKALITCHIS